jgi:uncharacterized protein (DUF1015 family)
VARYGTLRVDARPALYVYEQRVGGIVQRGLVGALALRDPAERIVLPHEDVMPWPVDDRLALLRATCANLEPILLVHRGGEATAAVVDHATARAPIAAAHAHGDSHHVWRVDDPRDLAAVAADLAGRTVLIADGHHRYAAYRRYQQERHSAGDGPGPWDYGLALLVDASRHPPQLRAIHRVVAGLSVARAVESSARLFRAREVTLTAGRVPRPRPGHFVVTDGATAYELTAADADAVARLVPGDRLPEWRRLDAAVLHHALLDAAWRTPERAISYEHSAAAALAAARPDRLAVLMAPVTVDVVNALAEQGERMPRKSTSFGPKPRSGLLMRRLCDDAA